MTTPYPVQLWDTDYDRFDCFEKGEEPGPTHVPFTGRHLTHLKWEAENGKTYQHKRGRGERPTIKVSLSSYAGISIGAMHYYGRVKPSLPRIYCIEEKSWYCNAGYGPNKPQIYGTDLDAEIWLTGKERNFDGEPLETDLDYTSRIETPEEVFHACLWILKTSFADDKVFYWQVEFDGFGRYFPQTVDVEVDPDDGEEYECTKVFRLSELETLV